jgi:hypothetical protein
VKSALRTVFVVLALSFHSTIEGKYTLNTNLQSSACKDDFYCRLLYSGMALALAEDSGGVWMSLGAVALHKAGEIREKKNNHFD